MMRLRPHFLFEPGMHFKNSLPYPLQIHSIEGL